MTGLWRLDKNPSQLWWTIKSRYKNKRLNVISVVKREIEQFFIAKIREQFPTHKIMGEEGFGDRSRFNGRFTFGFNRPNRWHIELHWNVKKTSVLWLRYKVASGLLVCYDAMRDRFVYGIKDYGAYCNGRLNSWNPQHLAWLNQREWIYVESDWKSKMIRKSNGYSYLRLASSIEGISK